MMDLQTEAKDGEDRTLLVPDEFDAVDTGTSDAESPSSPWLLKPRSLACMAGLALLGAVLFAGASHQSVAVPQKSNVEKTIELSVWWSQLRHSISSSTHSSRRIALTLFGSMRMGLLLTRTR
mmetsp:Transcript_94093/g.172457  ORF Transcript_94093/g.172457 Transcript_94093/m.172457 type:complete len:122 (-) Transcript_94093:99-464(-)